MIVKLLTEHHLEFLSLKGGCRGSSESTHVKIPHCWKFHALAQLSFQLRRYQHQLRLEKKTVSADNQQLPSFCLEDMNETDYYYQNG